MIITIESPNIKKLYKKYTELYQDRMGDLTYARSLEKIEEHLNTKGFIGFTDRCTKTRPRYIFTLKAK